MALDLNLTVRLIRCFKGWRNERLHNIWDAIAEYTQVLRVRWYSNPEAKLRHGQCLNRIWQEEREFDNRYVLITEADFLPQLKKGPEYWAGPEACVDGGADALLIPYAKRKVTRRMFEYNKLSGAWYMYFDKTKVPERLQFDTQPDPGCGILQQLYDAGNEITFTPGDDCYPRHYGISYPMGEHLFWTRHLHDDPAVRISGFPLGDIQLKHDEAVDKWISKSPREFRKILAHRFGKEILRAKDWKRKCT
jgi:hypothetical protein